MRYNSPMKAWGFVAFTEKIGVLIMKMNTKKAAAVAVAAVMACGLFAGCDLVFINESENMIQTVAEVNIKSSARFEKEFDDLNKELVDKVIGTVSVSKRDMIVSFLSTGYNNVNSGLSYEDVFNNISQGLAQRQLYVQYAKAYFMKYGWTDENGNQFFYNDLAKFNEYVKDEEGNELTGVKYDIAACGYFLTQEEKDKADFATRVMFNNSIDSLEDSHIEKKEDEKEYDNEVRTTPTGLNTTDSDFYDNDYRVYTGTGEQNSVRGSYEAKDDSTSTTRRRAYNDLLASLKSNDLIQKGEDTSDIETLNYFLLERKADYEDALIQKLGDVFTEQSEQKIDADYCNCQFASMLDTQRTKYAASSSDLEKAMESVSDTNFVLTATGDSPAESAYGFVINILLPFSAAQTDELNAIKQDYGDKKGNKFAARANLLKSLKATDRRGSWFRGATDYSFKATADMDAYGYSESGKTREWLFFEDSLKGEGTKYEPLKNYLGKYTYNGTWDEEARKYKPYQITVDEFIAEMEGYLTSDVALGAGKVQTLTQTAADYFDPAGGYYDGNGDVDYSKFVYYAGKVNFEGGFNANEMFKKESEENLAFSVINELSFAYNTDTAGLNSYLGYAITANKTSFVSEFEYASQRAVLAGAGNYVVVPSDYGWHIIYCTFSFVDTGYGATGGHNTPFKFDYDKIEEEGTFSNLFYESIKANTASSESTNRRSKIISSYNDSYEIFKDRYSDLTSLDKNA